MGQQSRKASPPPKGWSRRKDAAQEDEEEDDGSASDDAVVVPGLRPANANGRKDDQEDGAAWVHFGGAGKVRWLRVAAGDVLEAALPNEDSLGWGSRAIFRVRAFDAVDGSGQFLAVGSYDQSLRLLNHVCTPDMSDLPPANLNFSLRLVIVAFVITYVLDEIESTIPCPPLHTLLPTCVRAC